MGAENNQLDIEARRVDEQIEEMRAQCETVLRELERKEMKSGGNKRKYTKPDHNNNNNKKKRQARTKVRKEASEGGEQQSRDENGRDERGCEEWEVIVDACGSVV